MHIKALFDADFVSKKISDYIIINADITDEIRRDNVQYGVAVFIYNLYKFPLIFLFAYLLGILKYAVVSFLSFGFIRTWASGLHARTSLTCLISSMIILIGIPLLSLQATVSTAVIIFLFSYSLLLVLYFAPADTEERPIASMKLRKKLKMGAMVSLMVLFMLTFFVSPVYSNIITLSVLVECMLITPLFYRIFNKRYNNYKYL